MKLIRAIAFLAAALILLLHVLVPHEHKENPLESFYSHEIPDSFLDQIALGFHLSQTDGQLEDFPAENTTPQIEHQQMVAILAVVAFDIFSSSFTPAQRISTEQPLTFKSLNVSGFSHRGPPIS